MKGNFMPMLAYNTIKVVGNRETLEQFRKTVGSYGEEREVLYIDDQTEKVVRKMEKVVNLFDFEKIIPYPEGFEMVADADVEGDPALYWWNYENWSVESNSELALVFDDDIHLIFTFWTIWRYPKKIFDKIIKDWNTLEFYFDLIDGPNPDGIEAKASHGEWNYFYNYIVKKTGGYEDDGPEFYVLYRYNEMTGSFETIAQKWLPGEADDCDIDEFVDDAKFEHKLFLIERENLLKHSVYRARDILDYSKKLPVMEEED
jgi:hypothetical protein